MIKLESVGLRYGNGAQVLSDINLSIETGSCHLLVGSGGAGKTSLLRMLYLAQQPTSGLLRVFDHAVENLSRLDKAVLRRRMGIVFQDHRLLDHLSVFENVSLPLTLDGAAPDLFRERVDQMLDWLDLADMADAPASTLSNSARRCVTVARAVVSQPELILADEPVHELDRKTADQVMYLLSELNVGGTTVVVATRDSTLTRHHSWPVLRLDAGRLENRFN